MMPAKKEQSVFPTMPLVRAATRGEIGGGGFSDAVTGYLQPSRGKISGVKNRRISAIYSVFSPVHLIERILFEGRKSAFIDCIANILHQMIVVIEVVHDAHSKSKCFLGLV